MVFTIWFTRMFSWISIMDKMSKYFGGRLACFPQDHNLYILKCFHCSNQRVLYFLLKYKQTSYLGYQKLAYWHLWLCLSLDHVTLTLQVVAACRVFPHGNRDTYRLDKKSTKHDLFVSQLCYTQWSDAARKKWICFPLFWPFLRVMLTMLCFSSQ